MNADTISNMQSNITNLEGDVNTMNLFQNTFSRLKRALVDKDRSTTPECESTTLISTDIDDEMRALLISAMDDNRDGWVLPSTPPTTPVQGDHKILTGTSQAALVTTTKTCDEPSDPIVVQLGPTTKKLRDVVSSLYAANDLHVRKLLSAVRVSTNVDSYIRSRFNNRLFVLIQTKLNEREPCTNLTVPDIMTHLHTLIFDRQDTITTIKSWKHVIPPDFREQHNTFVASIANESS